MEELTENAEEPDDGDSKKEEQKLGKLQYKVLASFTFNLHLYIDNTDLFINHLISFQTAGVWL